MNDRMRRYMMTRNETEDKFRDSRGREHFENGRYSPRNEYDLGYTQNSYAPHMRLVPSGESTGMNRIGFDSGYRDYEDSRYRMDSGAGMPGEMSAGGAMSHEDDAHLTREIANAWVGGLKNADGTTGGHWPFEQTRQIMAQKAYSIDPIEFYVAINMMYSDYVKAAKEFNVNNVDFYACMAKAFLEDKDADDDKLMSYYYAIVEK